MKNKRIISLLLAVIIIFGTYTPISHAKELPDWWAYKFNTIESKEHFVPGSISPRNILYESGAIGMAATFLRLTVDEATINKTVAKRNTIATAWTGTEPGQFVIDGKKHDYSIPVKHEYRFEYDNGREDFIPLWLVNSENTKTKFDPEEVKHLKEKYIEVDNALQSLIDRIDRQGEPKNAGDYHPMQSNFIKNAKTELKSLLISGGTGDINFKIWLSPEMINSMIQKGYELIDYIESHRVNQPEILDFKVDGYSGKVDKQNKKIKLYVPENTKLNIKDAKIITPYWVISTYKSGELSIGKKATYSIQSIDALHHRYIKDRDYNVKEYEHMKEDWVIEVLDYKDISIDKLALNSLSYTSEYGERIYANITENEIEINIPFGVNLEEIELDVFHTGTEAFALDEDNLEIKIERNKVKNFKNVKKIKIKDDTLEKIYSFKIETKKSTNNEILDFRVNIDGVSHSANIDNENSKIQISVPFDTDISKLKTDIKIDPRSVIKPGQYEVQNFTSPVIYKVTSESGNERIYEAFIKKGEASSENEILSFKVGAIEGKIKDNNIRVEVPSTVNLKRIKPFMEISSKAKVKPANLEEIDFSKGLIEYTVTAENGEERVYKVSISSDGAEAVGPDEDYLNMLKTLRDNIYKRYKKDTTFEDWEWMNIGFYEGKDNGFPDGIRKTVDDLPEKFNLYKEIGELNANKTTDLDRFAMTLTAMGIDATNLEPFQIDGKPFRTDLSRPHGKEVINLVKMIYDGSSGGINGAIFALLALDMGDYTIPEDANTTRESLLKVLLEHEYGSDQFGIDMVAMLMQGLYPYQDDPIYGDKVMGKLEHGIDLFLGNKSATKVDPLSNEFLGISWGDVNSESTAQVIIALCSMGIDPYSDYRFSNGPKDNMIVNWINKFATSNQDGFGHTNSQYNFMGTYQSMYALQWYINFIENAGKSYSLYKDGVTFDFSEDLSTEAEIERFELLGKIGIIDNQSETITIELPEDTTNDELKNQAPIIIISENAKITPEIGSALDFNEDVNYKVVAEDGNTTKNYKVIINKLQGVESGKKEILDVKIEGYEYIKAVVNQKDRTVSIELPSNTSGNKLKELKLAINHNAENISPSPGGSQDFTKGEVVYTLTAKDGTTAKYKVKVSIKEEAPFWFTKFVLRGVEGKINKDTQVIDLKLPFGTFLGEVKPNEMKYEPIKELTSFSPGLSQLSDFSNPRGTNISIVPYPVDKKVDYKLNIDYITPTGDSKISEFSVAGIKANIKGNTIELNLPKGIDKYDVEDLIPTISWEGRTMDPDPKKDNNSMNNFYKDYVLTDEKGNINYYNVKIIASGEGSTEEPPAKVDKEEMKIESFTISGSEGQVDNANGRIYIELPYELDLRSVTPIIKLSKGSSIYPSSGQPLNLRRSARFALSNGKEVMEYVLIITISEPKPSTKLWRYIEDDDKTVDYQVVY